MQNTHRRDQRPGEFDEWLQEDRTPYWPRFLGIFLVIAVIVGLNVYFLSPAIQRRVEYAFLRAQAELRNSRPHDMYIPTPVLATQSTQLLTVVATPISTSTPSQAQPAADMPTAMPTATPLSPSVILQANCQEPQGWNNCGPATLSMALRFYGWTENQYTVSAATKPNKDDRNVSPGEMVAYTFSLGNMYAATGYATDIQFLKFMIANGFPVIVETWFVPEPNDEMGHYRLLTGYDDAAQQFVAQDSYSGPHQKVSYAELEPLWRVFNRVYVVVCEAGRTIELQALLSPTLDQESMYRSALAVALAEIAADPQDRYAWVTAGTNYVGLGLYEEAAAAYDQARLLRLPWRMLWYQFGPFEAYLHVGRYQDVINLADANLKTTPNLEESYYYRALARQALGDQAGWQGDLRQALRYNPNLEIASRLLGELGPDRGP